MSPKLSTVIVSSDPSIVLLTSSVLSDALLSPLPHAASSAITLIKMILFMTSSDFLQSKISALSP
jgi:hypothetical protein